MSARQPIKNHTIKTEHAAKVSTDQVWLAEAEQAWQQAEQEAEKAQAAQMNGGEVIDLVASVNEGDAAGESLLEATYAVAEQAACDSKSKDNDDGCAAGWFVDASQAGWAAAGAVAGGLIVAAADGEDDDGGNDDNEPPPPPVVAKQMIVISHDEENGAAYDEDGESYWHYRELSAEDEGTYNRIQVTAVKLDENESYADAELNGAYRTLTADGMSIDVSAQSDSASADAYDLRVDGRITDVTVSASGEYAEAYLHMHATGSLDGHLEVSANADNARALLAIDRPIWEPDSSLEGTIAGITVEASGYDALAVLNLSRTNASIVGDIEVHASDDADATVYIEAADLSGDVNISIDDNSYSNAYVSLILSPGSDLSGSTFDIDAGDGYVDFKLSGGEFGEINVSGSDVQVLLDAAVHSGVVNINGDEDSNASLWLLGKSGGDVYLNWVDEYNPGGFDLYITSEEAMQNQSLTDWTSSLSGDTDQAQDFLNSHMLTLNGYDSLENGYGDIIVFSDYDNRSDIWLDSLDYEDGDGLPSGRYDGDAALLNFLTDADAYFSEDGDHLDMVWALYDNDGDDEFDGAYLAVRNYQDSTHGISYLIDFVGVTDFNDRWVSDPV